jgi:gamma-glutamylcyclotransferase (GGCT)/AIG2-like uncharacterized protein YtfP
MTTCLLCDGELTAERNVRPSGEGFVHVTCGESLIFLYGTLRQGGRLEGWLPNGLYREAATLTGFALHYAPHYAYPYLVPTGDPADIVHGEVVVIPADDPAAVDAAIRTTDMETHAGYSPEAVTVTMKSGASRIADAFVWRHGNAGERIESGDWTQTPEWAPAPLWDEPEPEDERAVVRMHNDRGHLSLTGLDGTRIWEGSSYTEMGRWAKERNLRVE